MFSLPVQVVQRCLGTLIPKPHYVANYLTPSPDLYGPFWTLTTLIFALFVFSSLASSIVAYLSDEPVVYNFHLLSIAVTLVYAYGLGFPALLWIALRYLGVNDWSLIEAIALWGYGQFVWIPVAVRLFLFLSTLYLTSYTIFLDSLRCTDPPFPMDTGDIGFRSIWIFLDDQRLSDLGDCTFRSEYPRIKF